MPLKALNVLVAPLNWGLGHATRCVPLIKLLLDKGAHVYLASDGHSLAFLKAEFPHLECIELNSYGISYPVSGKNMFLSMFRQVPHILSAVKKEHQQLKQIVSVHNIHLIISDNRYGLWHRNTYNIFITHQLMLKMPAGLRFFEPLIHRCLKFMLRRFNEVWVPDYAGDINLSGDLSHTYNTLPHVSFIGPLSRFKATGDVSDEPCDILFMISGPEPQRRIFENIILNYIKDKKEHIVILRGVPGDGDMSVPSPNVKIFAHLSSEKIQVLLSTAKVVVARSGYSTLMDLAVTKKNALLIPTPGQTEQEYLASSLSKKGYFSFVTQDEFTKELPFDIENKTTPPGLPDFNQKEILSKKLYLIAENLNKKQKFA